MWIGNSAQSTFDDGAAKTSFASIMKHIISTVSKKERKDVTMKYILAIVLVIVMLLFAIITSILTEYKEEIWECIEFKEENDNDKK